MFLKQVSVISMCRGTLSVLGHKILLIALLYR